MSNIVWKISKGLVPYSFAMQEMEKIVSKIINEKHPEVIWLLEHPPLYTAGTSANDSDLLEKNRFPVYQVGRGGEFTYHGPGQLVGYLMLDLRKRKQDIRWFVKEIEYWLIEILKAYDIYADIREGRVGLWVNNQYDLKLESKIAAIGIRVKKWVTFHGFALNISTNLEHYSGIVPCGIKDFGITSMAALGKKATKEDIQKKLIDSFNDFFMQP